MFSLNSKALKEWAVVVKAVGSGEQIILFRKGGIHDRQGAFELENREFFFFPSFEHQKTALLKSSYKVWVDELESSKPGNTKLMIDTYATVEKVLFANSIPALERIQDSHIWTTEYVADRLNYKPEKPLYVLLLRAYKLKKPALIENLAEYAGCVSWVDLRESLPTFPLEPVVPDEDFSNRVKDIEEKLKKASII